MKLTWKNVLRVVLGLVTAFIIFVVVTIGPTFYRVYIGYRIYEKVPPVLPRELARPAILIFSKTNGFRHEDAIPAANKLLGAIAREHGWGIFFTNNGAVFSAKQLTRFDAVVWNNVSGDVLTEDQRQAFKTYIEAGGGFVAFHGSGGDPRYRWRWYVEHLIGAQFIGHTQDPQLQNAVVRIRDRNHPATRDMPSQWNSVDEWYSFDRSVRRSGYHVLADVDERSYQPGDVAMGIDHPIAWWHCEGRGRAFYSALGHRPEIYAEPNYKKMLAGALVWATRQDGKECR